MQTPPPRVGWLRNRDRFALDTGVRRRTELAQTSAGQTSPWREGVLRLRALLVQRNAVWAIIAVSMTLCAPALVTGLVLDDNFHAVALRDNLSIPGAKRAAWDAYNFASNPAQMLQMVEASVFPWWSDPQARLAFFRPLSSLSLWLDHQLWPKAPVLMHMHNLLWYALLLVVIARVYRRFSARAFSLGFAGLALLLYAVDDAHAMSVGWLANRAALAAFAVGLAALLAHDSWRTSGRTRHLAASLALLALALGFGEAAFQAVAYLVAYALFFDGGARRDRWKSLMPYAVLLGAFLVCYVAAGFGPARTALYIQPVRDPIGFAQAALVRLPVLLAAQFGGLSADLGEILKYVSPTLTGLLLPLSVAVVAVFAWLIYPLWSSRREVRFWLAGTLLSTIPVCALAPADRLLVGTGLGGSALIAILLLAALDRAREFGTRSRKVWAVTLGVIHLVIAPLLLPLQSYGLSFLASYIGRAERSLPDGEEAANKTVVLLNPPTDEFGIYMAYHRIVRGGVSPEHIRWIANGDSDLLLTRVDATTLRVKPSEGFLAPGALWTVRDPDFHSQVGDRVELQGTVFTVTDVTADGRPAEVLVKFDRAIDSDQFVWMRWDNRDGFARFTLPNPGHSMLVPAVDRQSVMVDSEPREG